MNDWVSELIETGYLHNHTRMVFASMDFYFKFTWQLGAGFFLKHSLMQTLLLIHYHGDG